MLLAVLAFVDVHLIADINEEIFVDDERVILKTRIWKSVVREGENEDQSISGHVSSRPDFASCRGNKAHDLVIFGDPDYHASP